ncbi:glucose inhibited division protein a homologue, putative [Plasmodium gallinaceum]|uniref:Glucose inhibited division protein a homologue, putative n=1 Tax=Plasmodium gallinaceum TaxID=5849 RepID=A0A1J1GWX7_PLAGA|nr:glucose inhibited division protein a homologue, putative [Plasmodium gallinaceum]CRG97067.1 glucose inhibited division protein a homologue, putative [Plasmodium gallinaceum]
MSEMLLNLYDNIKKKTLFYVILLYISLILPYNFYHLKNNVFFLGTSYSFKKKKRNTIKNIRIYNSKCVCENVDKNYDVIVIGGGHSGCEASYISAKLNAKTLLITQNKNSIGEMSCNPSIGGIGKGILVKEIDALGGLMGKVIDKSGIHFKILNLKKGLAVRGHRAQADRDLYNYYMKKYILNTKNLYIIENTVQSLLIENFNDKKKRVYGIKNKCSCEFYAYSVILTTGTFLGGICHIGKEKYHGGRIKRVFNSLDCNESNVTKNYKSNNIDLNSKNEKIQFTKNICINKNVQNYSEKCNDEINNGIDSIFDNLIESSTKSIANQLKEYNFEINRMKTGTPPRLDINSINFDILDKEDTEKKNPFYFSFLNSNKINNNKTLPCYKTYTNENTHNLVKKYLNELPDFDSYDKLGNGPRYCPSIAKKVTKFADKKKHIIWIEPEGLNDTLIYPNGLSSAFPIHVQKKIVNSIKGLEEAKIIFPAYDVEYYYVNPKCLNYTLETKNVKGLFLAGQICGTTGYEEAACQGIVAGINAALSSSKNKMDTTSFVLKRNDSYIGVLIHDLINKGVTEPYRMFTSRAEYRLYLRPDNSDIRLTPKADKLGIVSKERIYILNQKYNSVNKLIFIFKKLFFNDIKKKKNTNRNENTSFCSIESNNSNQNDCKMNFSTQDNSNNSEKNIKIKSYKKIKENDESKNVINSHKNSLNNNCIDNIVIHNDSIKDTRDGLIHSNDNINFTLEHDKKNMKSLYNILKSGVEYPLDVLLHKLKDMENLSQFKSMLSNDENHLNIYMDKYNFDTSLLKCENILINLTTLETACAEVKYSPYLKKQIQEINKIKDNFNLIIPSYIKYNRDNFPYLSNEEIEKLNKFKPQTLYDANKIEGVTMSAIYYLYYYIKSEKNK